ncbi:MAG: patatin-like phospholipase family protein [Candidatus Pseudobacter hemicellulosilyticus]|uniref:Patatin-like phospholipase family protein n=1 Tax=Candidatus Pseudobacter hemicellulosilyticus TaxID=3121375 RepID=A0AAJ5WSH1_9BACT|nr:MAG: patatin-like phospholipase family protein [Pseudobacter sp.]
MSLSPKNKIGLALSGGGYRATAFHLGTLRTLHRLGILDKVDVISTISGGSITGACYMASEKDFPEFYEELYMDLQRKNVIKWVLLSPIGLRFLLLLGILGGSFYFLFAGPAWLFPVIWLLVFILLYFFQFALLPISRRIEKVYNRFFYKGMTLDQLPAHPRLVIGATNLQTARPFVFSRTYMQDSTYQFLDEPIKFNPKGFPLARAVMASSCVPFAFTPVRIHRKFFQDPAQAKTIHPILVDGGVYDNQGIHKVMQKGSFACDIVITSDAGAGSSGELRFRNTFSLLLETVEVFMSRIKKVQMVRNVYDNAATAGKEIAYLSLGWDLDKCIPGFISNLAKGQITDKVKEAHGLLPEWIADPNAHEAAITQHLQDRTGYSTIKEPGPDAKALARKVGTNLTALSKARVDALVGQAAALTELQVKLYCPSLFTTKP